MIKRKLAIGLAAALLLGLLSGCIESSDSEILVEEKEASPAKTIENVEGMDIADQVQVPERYQTQLTGSAGIMNVTVDADFVIPEATGFKLKRVEGRDITQEDVDRQGEVLLDGQKLTQRIYPEEELAGGWTKDELLEMIRSLEEHLAKNGEGLGSEEQARIEEELVHLQNRLEFAPQTYETEEVEMVLSVDANPSVRGDVVLNGLSYQYYAENNFYEGDFWIQSSLDRMNSYYTAEHDFIGMKLEGMDNPPSISKEEAIEKGNKLVNDLGLKYMKPAAWEHGLTGDILYDENIMVVHKKAWILYYTRVVEGIPITYTNDQGISVRENNAGVQMDDYGNEAYPEQETTAAIASGDADEWFTYKAWPYEGLQMVYDDQGLAGFNWSFPYSVTDLSDEYVFLMPFSEIRTIFEEMITKKEENYIADYMDQVYYHINEIRLGYMRVRDNDSPLTGTLIPVWDFFGTTEWYYPPGQAEEVAINDALHQSLLTINAMDGSVVDREYGY